MTRIGIVGHRDISPLSLPIVEAAVRRLLIAKGGSRLVGVCGLAPGADQLFAQLVLDLSGRLEVILPSADYRAREVPLDNSEEFDRLLGSAATVRVMNFEQSCRQAYMAAGTAMLSTVETLIAIWDGRPAKRLGGASEVVGAAARLGVPTSVVWPPGATRERPPTACPVPG
ncbi:MAG: hypothetical protein QOD82_2505 [Pseudonocardiales bacterium]|jgi:hypothetical protein|nr:hypothetical protein [Pseudonocardiales bacterium]